jgi:branched-chain amino acid transport system substrate-binding protein
LENTGWGRSSKTGFDTAASQLNILLKETQWFNWGLEDFQDILTKFAAENCDVIMFVGSAREGKQVVNSLIKLPKADQLPIISHWGVTGANFVDFAGPAALQVDMVFLQTYSFLMPTNISAAENFTQRYFAKYKDSSKVTDILAPVGSAHAYDLVHMLAQAIKLAGSTDRARVRDALENLTQYDGLVRSYAPPFTPTRHDALDASDFRLARFGADGSIIPIKSAP